MRGDKKMTIEQAIKTVESIIDINKGLIEREEEDNFAIFLVQQNRALETLLNYVKGQLN